MSSFASTACGSSTKVDGPAPSAGAACLASEAHELDSSNKAVVVDPMFATSSVDAAIALSGGCESSYSPAAAVHAGMPDTGEICSHVASSLDSGDSSPR